MEARRSPFIPGDLLFKDSDDSSVVHWHGFGNFAHAYNKWGSNIVTTTETIANVTCYVCLHHIATGITEELYFEGRRASAPPKKSRRRAGQW